MRIITAAVLTVSLLGAAVPAGAAESRAPDDWAEAGRLAGRAAGRLVQQLDRLWRAVPRYEAPEVLDNGDIVIRRRPAPLPGAPATAGPSTEAI